MKSTGKIIVEVIFEIKIKFSCLKYFQIPSTWFQTISKVLASSFGKILSIEIKLKKFQFCMINLDWYHLESMWKSQVKVEKPINANGNAHCEDVCVSKLKTILEKNIIKMY